MRTFRVLKHEISGSFPFLGGQFDLPGSGFHSRSKSVTQLDPDSDPKHCKQGYHWHWDNDYCCNIDATDFLKADLSIYRRQIGGSEANLSYPVWPVLSILAYGRSGRVRWRTSEKLTVYVRYYSHLWPVSKVEINTPSSSCQGNLKKYCNYNQMFVNSFRQYLRYSTLYQYVLAKLYLQTGQKSEDSSSFLWLCYTRETVPLNKYGDSSSAFRVKGDKCWNFGGRIAEFPSG